jgi:UDPglucose--hexose-1-phosphate uridylyltransferase
MRLADGRQLIYFDERDDAVRATVDRRHLPPHAPRAELRHDPTLDEWVAIASHRQDRTFLPPADECPLCPSTEARPSEIPAASYDVVVFENRFPSFAPPAVETGGPGGDGGRCEVVCFTDDHDLSFSGLAPSRVRTVIDAWADRTAELSRAPDVAQVFCFENRGEEIGVTLSHPHGQIYGYPFVAPVTTRMLAAARAHRARHGTDLFDHVLADERSGPRMLVATDRWTAFVPAAARWPFEVHVLPNRRVPDLAALDDVERDELAVVYLDVLRRLDSVFDLPMPYIAAWHQAPVRVDRDLARLHLRLFSARRAPGKLKFLAGSEAAMGAFVNDITPEDAADLMRTGAASPS